MLLQRAAFSLRPPISTPSLFCLVPSLKLSSPLLTPQFTCALPRLHHQTAFPKPLLALNPSHHLHSLCFKRLLPWLASHQFRPGGITASYCTGTGDGKNGTSSDVGREILVQHLLVKEDDLKLLVELQKRIFAGEDLSDLAVDYSICPSKEQGGMLGWVRKGQMVEKRGLYDRNVCSIIRNLDGVKDAHAMSIASII